MGSTPKRLKAIIKDPQHFRRFVENIQLLKTRQDFMDLCFVCARGQKVYAHKLLLSSVSSLMKKMFLEIPAGLDIVTIHLPDVESRLMKLMLEFLYEGVLRIDKANYTEFLSLHTLLGIEIQRKSSLQQQPPETLSSSQPVQPQAVFYMQAPVPNSQGQVQYVMASPQGQMMQMTQAAAPSQLVQVTPANASGQMMQVTQAAAPGQMMQVTQAAPGQMMQVTQAAPGQLMQVTQGAAPGQMMQVNQGAAPGQMMQVTQAAAPGQTTGQVIQAATPNTSMPQGQMMQMAPAIMSQANGQMVQGESQVVSAQMQQTNMLQVVPQNSMQVVPMVAGNQMVQCSSQMVVQASMNQTVQPTQRPQYVMASSSNQMTTSRVRSQYNQPQITPQQRVAARSRVTTLATQPTTTRNSALNSVRARRVMRGPMPQAQNRSVVASRALQRSRHSAQ